MPREVETEAKPLHWWVCRICRAFVSIIGLIVFADHAFSLIIWLCVRPLNHDALDHGRWKLSCERRYLLPVFGVFTTVMVVKHFASKDASEAAERAPAVYRQGLSSVKCGRLPSKEGSSLFYDDDDLIRNDSSREKIERWLRGLESRSKGSILKRGSRAETAMAKDFPQSLPFSSAKSPTSAKEGASRGNYVAQETKWAKDVPGPNTLSESPSAINLALCERDLVLTNGPTMQVTKHADSVSRNHSATVVNHCSQAKSSSSVKVPMSEEGQASLGDKTVQAPKRAEYVSTSPSALVMSPSSVKSTSHQGSQIPPDNEVIKQTKHTVDGSADHGAIAVSDSAIQSVNSKKGQSPSENKTAQVTTNCCLQRKPFISIVSTKLDEQANIQKSKALGHCDGPSAEQDRRSLPAETRFNLKDFQTPDQISWDTSSLAQSTPCPIPRPRVMHKPVANGSHSHNQTSNQRSKVTSLRQEESSPAQSPMTTLMAEEMMVPESLRERRKFYKDLLYRETRTWPFAPTEKVFKDLLYYDDDDDQPLQDISALKNEQLILEGYARNKALTYFTPFHMSGVPEIYEIERLRCWLSLRNHRRDQESRPFPPGYKAVSKDRMSLHNPLTVPVSPLLD